MAAWVLAWTACVAPVDSASAANLPDSVAYAARYTSGNKVGLALSNYGVLGNSFTSTRSSFAIL